MITLRWVRDKPRHWRLVADDGTAWGSIEPKGRHYNQAFCLHPDLRTPRDGPWWVLRPSVAGARSSLENYLSRNRCGVENFTIERS